MKTILALLFASISCAALAQLSDAELNRLKYKTDSAASLLHAKLIAKNETLLRTTFTVDTFKIEKLLQFKTSADTSQAEYVAAIVDSEIEYDILMNKYYKALLGLHDDEGKKLLTASQKKWLKYRDEEILMTEKFYNEQHIGDARTKEVAKAKEHLELTKERVVELFKHIEENSKK